MYGPIQLSVIGFDRDDVAGGLLDQIDLVRELGIIRLIDFLFVEKDKFGNIEAMEVSDLTQEERMEFGAVVGGLIGLGAAGREGAEVGAVVGALAVAENDFGMTAEDIQEIADDIPKSSSALIVLFEHTWALGIKNYAFNNGGVLLAQGLIHPSALVEVGIELREAVEAEAALEAAEAEEEAASTRQSNLARGKKSKGTSTKKMRGK